MTEEPHFQPINQAHAIAEMLVFFQFVPDLGAILPTLASVQNELQSEFPSALPLQQVRFEVANGVPSAQSAMGGLQLSRSKPDGSPEWVIHIGLDTISIHCTDYSRWHLIWPEMRSYFEKIFKRLGGAPIEIGAIGLKYIERFLWRGSEADYDANLLFDAHGPYLCPQSFNSGPRWHCHIGWFAKVPEIGEILNQLNIDSGGHLLAAGENIIVNIDHTMTLRAINETHLSSYVPIEGGEKAPLDDLIQTFHGANKLVLLSLLRSDVAECLNLRIEP